MPWLSLATEPLITVFGFFSTATAKLARVLFSGQIGWKRSATLYSKSKSRRNLVVPRAPELVSQNTSIWPGVSGLATGSGVMPLPESVTRTGVSVVVTVTVSGPAAGVRMRKKSTSVAEQMLGLIAVPFTRLPNAVACVSFGPNGSVQGTIVAPSAAFAIRTYC